MTRWLPVIIGVVIAIALALSVALNARTKKPHA